MPARTKMSVDNPLRPFGSNQYANRSVASFFVAHTQDWTADQFAQTTPAHVVEWLQAHQMPSMDKPEPYVAWANTFGAIQTSPPRVLDPMLAQVVEEFQRQTAPLPPAQPVVQMFARALLDRTGSKKSQERTSPHVASWAQRLVERAQPERTQALAQIGARAQDPTVAAGDVLRAMALLDPSAHSMLASLVQYELTDVLDLLWLINPEMLGPGAPSTAIGDAVQFLPATPNSPQLWCSLVRPIAISATPAMQQLMDRLISHAQSNPQLPVVDIMTAWCRQLGDPSQTAYIILDNMCGSRGEQWALPVLNALDLPPLVFAEVATAILITIPSARSSIITGATPEQKLLLLQRTWTTVMEEGASGAPMEVINALTEHMPNPGDAVLALAASLEHAGLGPMATILRAHDIRAQLAPQPSASRKSQKM